MSAIMYEDPTGYAEKSTITTTKLYILEWEDYLTDIIFGQTKTLAYNVRELAKQEDL